MNLLGTIKYLKSIRLKILSIAHNPNRDLNRYEVHKHCPRQSLDESQSDEAPQGSKQPKGCFYQLLSDLRSTKRIYTALLSIAPTSYTALKLKNNFGSTPLSKRTKSQPGLEPIRGSQTLPTAEFGQRQIFAPAKSAYMPSLAIPRRGQNSPKAVFINSSPTYGAQYIFTQPYYLLHLLASQHKAPAAFSSSHLLRIVRSN